MLSHTYPDALIDIRSRTCQLNGLVIWTGLSISRKCVAGLVLPMNGCPNPKVHTLTRIRACQPRATEAWGRAERDTQTLAQAFLATLTRATHWALISHVH